MGRNIKNGCVRIGDTDMYYASFGNGEKKMIVLPGLGDGLAVSGDTITLPGTGVSEEEMGAILHESGAVLLEFTQKRETLESYFISLIGGNSHA